MLTDHNLLSCNDYICIGHLKKLTFDIAFMMILWCIAVINLYVPHYKCGDMN